MEHYILCNSCGKGFVYTDEDVKNNKATAGINLLSAVGQISSALSGNQVGYIANKMNEKELRTFDKCPHCGSTDLSKVSKEEFQKAQKPTTGTVAPSVSINTNASIPSLIKRTVLFLEDHEWEKAELYCEQILDADPENAQVYLLLALTENKVSSPNELISKGIDLRKSKYYKSIIRFGSDKFKSSIAEINRRFDARQLQEAERLEAEAAKRIEKKYLKALSDTNSDDIEVLESAINALEKIGVDYKDAQKYIDRCKTKIQLIEKERSRKRRKNITTISIILIALLLLCGFAYALQKYIIPKIKYQKAVNLFETSQFDEAILLFSELNGYKDSKMLSERATSEKEKFDLYNSISDMLDKGDYIRAYQALEKLGDYKDSKNRMEEIKDEVYDAAIKLINNEGYGNNKLAYQLLSSLQDYKESLNYISNFHYVIKSVTIEYGTAARYTYDISYSSGNIDQIAETYYFNSKKTYEISYNNFKYGNKDLVKQYDLNSNVSYIDSRTCYIEKNNDNVLVKSSDPADDNIIYFDEYGNISYEEYISGLLAGWRRTYHQETDNKNNVKKTRIHSVDKKGSDDTYYKYINKYDSDMNLIGYSDSYSYSDAYYTDQGEITINYDYYYSEKPFAEYSSILRNIKLIGIIYGKPY